MFSTEWEKRVSIVEGNPKVEEQSCSFVEIRKEISSARTCSVETFTALQKGSPAPLQIKP